MNRFRYINDYVKPLRPAFYTGQQWRIQKRLSQGDLSLVLMEPGTRNLSGVMTPGWNYINISEWQWGAMGWMATSVLEANYEQI